MVVVDDDDDEPTPPPPDPVRLLVTGPKVNTLIGRVSPRGVARLQSLI